MHNFPDIKSILHYAGIDIYSRSPTSPISLRIVCERFKIRYKKIPMDPNTCGMLVRTHKGPYIFINEDHNYTRRRFSNAHEIGHYFLGHDSDVSMSNDQNRFEEVQANRFASALLMPEDLFHCVHKEQRSIKEMAHWLRVSPISVAIRCLQFGLRRCEAEYMRSEYFQASEFYQAASEIAASKEKLALVAESKPVVKAERVYYPPSEETIRYNNKMIDRYRQMYGYD